MIREKTMSEFKVKLPFRWNLFKPSKMYETKSKIKYIERVKPFLFFKQIRMFCDLFHFEYAAKVNDFPFV